jgi:hypothetical protein
MYVETFEDWNSLMTGCENITLEIKLATNKKMIVGNAFIRVQFWALKKYLQK